MCAQTTPTRTGVRSSLNLVGRFTDKINLRVVKDFALLEISENVSVTMQHLQGTRVSHPSSPLDGLVVQT